jgi:hypothetical protein
VLDPFWGMLYYVGEVLRLGDGCVCSKNTYIPAPLI